MVQPGFESFEQPELDGSLSETGQFEVVEKTTGDKIIDTAIRFMPGIQVIFDESSDEIVLRENFVE